MHAIVTLAGFPELESDCLRCVSASGACTQVFCLYTMSSHDNAAVPPIDDTLRASLEGNAAGEALLRAMRADPSFHEDE